MSDRTNTIFGWLLFAGIIALGLSIVSGMYFHANEEVEEFGYFIDAPEEGAAEEAGYDLGTLLAAADPAAGEKVYAKCTACHSIAQGGPAGIGPNLWAIMGKPIAQGGFAYSSALAGHGGAWTYENMDAWLENPRAFAPGTKMSFAGLSKPEDRANIMAYMKENGGGPAYPEPVEIVTEGIDGAGEGPGVVEGAPAGAMEAAGAMGDEQPVPSEGGGAVRNDSDAKPGN